jgi:hypothetical protein
MEDFEKPFTITIDLNGEPAVFDVQPIDEYYVLTRNGEFFAEVLPNEMWYQQSGELLDDDVLMDIGTAIERHYD